MKRGHSFDVILTMLLFGVFTCSVLAVLMMGAQSYQGIATTIQESYEERTCLQYIATKITHFSGENAVTVTEFGDGSALALEQTINDNDYITYIYCYNGYAMELFCEKGVYLEPSAGFHIMEVAELSMVAVADNLIHLTCTGSGGSAELFVGLRGEGGLE